MKIYFTTSTAEFNKYRENYFAIRDFVVAEKHILTFDWLDTADQRIKSNHKELNDIKEIYKKCIKAIDEADLIIIEDSVSNFSTGHQITVALQRQKPTLVLNSIIKTHPFNQSFIQGVESDYLQISEYNSKNYREVIRSFIKKYSNALQKNRFHLVLDEVERKYLDWAQYNKHMSRTKIIRESIRKAIDCDSNYQKYLEARDIT